MSLDLDYETTSECPIELGGHRYAADPTTRILMFCVARDEGEPLLWRFDDPYSEESLAAWGLLHDAIENNEPIYAHNATQFEVPVSINRLMPDVGIPAPHEDQWRCTLAMCRRAAAPESLEAAAEFFGLEVKKDGIGKALIGIFSDQTKSVTLEPPPGMKDPSTMRQLKNGNFTVGKKPKNRKSPSPILDDEVLWDWQVKVAGEPMTVRAAWDAFCSYCKTDVKVQRALRKKLSHFELKGSVLESYQFDLRLNCRGVPVNVAAIRNAESVVATIQEKLSARFQRMCGLMPSQRDAVQKWLQERGYPEDNLQAGTVEKVLENPPEAMSPLAVEVLRMRSLVSFSALAKLPTMREAACEDGRVRGTLQWHAARTMRPGGRLLQPQNLRKSTIDDSDFCYRLICEGWEPEWFETFWDSPLEAIASSIRHFIQPAEGELLDADYIGVEARITPWLAGDQRKLQLILEGVDLYKRMATFVFGVPYDQVTKEQRTISKPIELGCCFMVGGKGLRDAMAKPPYNIERTLKECRHYVKTYRDNHPETVEAWKSIEEAAKKAIHRPGDIFQACNGKLAFQCGRAAGIPYLTMRLPSGRKIYYPHPKIKATWKAYDEEEMEELPWKREEKGYWIDQISFYGKMRDKPVWGRVATWGGRLFENAVQAIGADLLYRGCCEAERRGFPICMIVHDQALSETSKSGGGIEEFTAALCTKDEWAADFPLEASGAVHPYYLKD